MRLYFQTRFDELTEMQLMTKTPTWGEWPARTSKAFGFLVCVFLAESMRSVFPIRMLWKVNKVGALADVTIRKYKTKSWKPPSKGVHIQSSSSYLSIIMMEELGKLSL